ncbi:HNH endonuclease family protein [Mycobacterium talmoniae]|nr:HNH endonuclease family protein [Mycobacterium eburneum]TDH56008.1 HNH endonuclease [Mycobacterium eburneum]
MISRDHKTPLIIAGAVVVCLLIVVTFVLVAVHDSPSGGPPLTSSYPTPLTASYPTTSPGTAASAELAKLATIPIKGRAPKTGYDRALFGTPWTDDVTVPGGHNGCDTRNDILRRDLAGAGYKPGRKACIVLSGTLKDPYTGEVIMFSRGPRSNQIQVDHIVPILDAWQKGAQQWDDLKRRNFANDPMNLQTTSAAANREKGSADAATWLPPNTAYRCTYVSRMVDVKSTYGVWMTQAEHDAIERILHSCPN